MLFITLVLASKVIGTFAFSPRCYPAEVLPDGTACPIDGILHVSNFYLSHFDQFSIIFCSKTVSTTYTDTDKGRT